MEKTRDEWVEHYTRVLTKAGFEMSIKCDAYIEFRFDLSPKRLLFLMDNVRVRITPHVNMIQIILTVNFPNFKYLTAMMFEEDTNPIMYTPMTIHAGSLDEIVDFSDMYFRYVHDLTCNPDKQDIKFNKTVIDMYNVATGLVIPDEFLSPNEYDAYYRKHIVSTILDTCASDTIPDRMLGVTEIIENFVDMMPSDVLNFIYKNIIISKGIPVKQV